jgi:hypothetical protein
MAKKKPPEAVSGTYTAISHRVLDSHAFMGASHIARSLLFDLMRQHNGRNNGHIQATNAWLKQRGWASVDVIFKARNELIERGLIVLTKQGGRNIGASLYALTWMTISDFIGLDLRRDHFQQGVWARLDSEPLTKKRGTRSVPRNSTVPSHGAASLGAAPSDGTKPAPFGGFTVPPDGKDVLPMYPPLAPFTGRRTKRAIVGKPKRKTGGHDTQH